MTLTAATGDLAGCTLNNLHIGPATPLFVGTDGHFFKAAFNKSDLAAILPAFNSVGRHRYRDVAMQWRVEHDDRAWDGWRREGNHRHRDGQAHHDDRRERVQGFEWQRPARPVRGLAPASSAACRGPPVAHDAGRKSRADAHRLFQSDREPRYIQNLNIHYLTLRGGFATAGAAASSLNDWQKVAEGTRLGIPLVINSNPLNNLGGGDAVFEPGGGPGLFSVWPGTLGLAATNDPQLIKDFAEIARAEWRATGIRKDYGYQVDVATEPRWTRNRTTFGEGPGLNASITRSIVLGFQGQQLGPDSIAQTIKHFPGHGPEPLGLDAHNAEGQFTAYPTPGSLFAYHIVPFQAAVDAGHERDNVVLPNTF